MYVRPEILQGSHGGLIIPENINMAAWTENGCYCCDLEVACYVVAALDLLLSVAGVVYGSFDMATVTEIERHRSIGSSKMVE